MIQTNLFEKDSNQNNIFFVETINSDSKYSTLIEKNILKEGSNLSEWIIGMNGMSGKKYRHFINNLISDIGDARYLEIGCWKGSTTCSAIYKNSVDAYCVDNWTEFGGPKNIFYENVKRCVDEFEDTGVTFVESDFRNINYEEIGKYNVYLFDGPHSREDQRDGLSYAQSALDDEFIFICDDWNWEKVRDGTFDAINELKLNILYSIDIRTTNDNSYPPEDNTMEKSDWHNGYYISVLSKN